VSYGLEPSVQFPDLKIELDAFIGNRPFRFKIIFAPALQRPEFKSELEKLLSLEASIQEGRRDSGG